MRPPQKVTTKSEIAHSATTRAQSRKAPARAHQFLRACAVEIHFQAFEVVNSSELAGQCWTRRESTSITPPALTTTLFGEVVPRRSFQLCKSSAFWLAFKMKRAEILQRWRIQVQEQLRPRGLAVFGPFVFTMSIKSTTVQKTS